MMEKMNGLSLDFIVHPGETLREVLEENDMSQEELAVRTGFSAKHISEVVNGKKGISSQFSKSLEYVFDMPMSFWTNLQSIYDREILLYKEKENIEKLELNIVKKIKPLMKYAEELKLAKFTENYISQIIEVRSFCGINNLTNIAFLPASNIAFRKSTKYDIDIEILYMWIRICEKNIRKIQVINSYNVEILKKNIQRIKATMFLEINEAIKELTKIFAECGILFQVMKHFTGAPVQGVIKKKDNKIMLTMTIRGAFADIFWFTLFHEIGHLINQDITEQYIDYYSNDSKNEIKADNFAKDILINQDEFNKFIQNKNIVEKDINEFAKKQNVPNFIVVGRIEKEKNNYTIFSNMRKKYLWNK